MSLLMAVLERVKARAAMQRSSRAGNASFLHKVGIKIGIGALVGDVSQ